MSNKKCVKVVFDVGGFAAQYRVQKKTKIIDGEFNTKGKNKDQVLDKIAKIINTNNATKIVVAAPGVCNSKTGFISGISGICGWSNFNFYNDLKKKLKSKKIKLFLINDAKAALLTSLKSHPVKSAVQITIGTGIGGAIFLNGKVYSGNNGWAGEFGYIPILNQKKEKTVSEFLSTEALLRKCKLNSENAKQLFNSKHFNKKIIEEWIYELTKFIITVNFVINPEIIFLYGGITQNKYFQKKLNVFLKKSKYQNLLKVSFTSQKNFFYFSNYKKHTHTS